MVLLLHVWVSSDVAVGLNVGHSWGTVSVSMLIVAPHEEVLSGKSKSIRRLGSLNVNFWISLKVALGLFVGELLVGKLVSLLLSSLGSPVLDSSLVVLLAKKLLEIRISVKVVLGLSFGHSFAEKEDVSPSDILLLVIMWVISIKWSWMLLANSPCADLMWLLLLTVIHVSDSGLGDDLFLDAVLSNELLRGLPDKLVLSVFVSLLVCNSLIVLFLSNTLELMKSSLSQFG